MSPKLAPPDPKDGKEKPSRNLEMEGQRVRTINPSRENRNASARQLRGASKAEAKRSCSQKTVLTNAQPKRRRTKLKHKSQPTLNYQRNTGSREKVKPSKKSKKHVTWTKRKSCNSQAKTTRTREREPPQKKGGSITRTAAPHTQA